MTSPLLRLGTDALRSLADALDDGRIARPYRGVALRSFCATKNAEPIAAELERLAELGAAPSALAAVVRILADTLHATASASRPSLVWTGPEVPTAATRETWVVARELFETATDSVVLSSFALHGAGAVLEPLARRMDELPTLRVRMYLNVERAWRDDRSDQELLRLFAAEFREDHWPGRRIPEVFYDTRSLLPDQRRRACLHAKCIIVDAERVLLTSANLTEAAHHRNIEAGILIRDHTIASSLARQFDSLIASGDLVSMPGL